MKWILSAVLLFSIHGYSQEVINLYSIVPNSKPAPGYEEKSDVDNQGKLRISKVSTPTLTIFLPEKSKANGTAVIICPGGGYGILAFSHEGTDVARQLNEWGVAAFVLKYRLPGDEIMPKREIGPLQDAQRAIQLVRENAKKWNIKPKKIGIMGFSAGGHLASTAGTHFNKQVIENGRTSVRPDFMVLLYPVISFSDSLTHRGSRKNLIGDPATPDQINYYSNELQITRKTPPAFLMHAKDDNVVKIENSYVFVNALKKNKVKSKLVVYEKGGHGFGMNNPTTSDKWMNDLKVWLTQLKFIR